MMNKIYLILLISIVSLTNCQSDSKTDEDLSEEEKVEIQKVESLKKTDKEKEDSVKAYWEEKMKKSKVED